MGALLFDRRARDRPVLAVRFDRRVDLGDMSSRPEPTRLIFEDGWLHDINEPQRQVVRRQLGRVGGTSDPMRLDGPFPLPIGQKSQDVLRLFQVEALSGPPDRFTVPKASDRDLAGVRLTPRDGSGLKDRWATIDVWYDRANWLPVGVIATEPNGDLRRIRLTNLARHDEVPAAAAAMRSTDVPEDWFIDVRPLTSDTEKMP